MSKSGGSSERSTEYLSTKIEALLNDTAAIVKYINNDNLNTKWSELLEQWCSSFEQHKKSPTKGTERQLVEAAQLIDVFQSTTISKVSVGEAKTHAAKVMQASEATQGRGI